MNKQCSTARQQWAAQKQGALSDPRVMQELKEHFGTCSACREYAYGENLTVLLQESYGNAPPEPSDTFLPGLHRQLAAAGRAEEKNAVPELFARAGLRLVPAMAAVLFFLTSTLAYITRDDAAQGSAASVEEIIFSEEEAALSPNQLLSAAFLEEVRYAE